MQKNRSSLSRWHLLTIFLIAAVAALITKEPATNLAEDTPGARVRACQSNLKRLATGLEMYATDNSGHYPSTLSALVPTYVESVPSCPKSGLDTYSQAYQTGPDAPGNSENYQDYYYVYCFGEHHSDAGLASDSPSYDCRLGVQPTLPFDGSPLEGLQACQGKMKSIATALEMYYTDWNGNYPSTLAKLLPDYLPAVPVCPVAGTDTYSVTFEQGPSSPHNPGDFANFYYFSCSGGHHKEAGKETGPSFNSVEGFLP